LEEANNWYRTGKGEALNVDLSKIDLQFIRPSDFNDKVGKTKAIQTLWSSKEGKIYGNLTLTYVGDNKVSAKFDVYDFEMHSWANPVNWLRNGLTIYANPGVGEGFRINFYGYGAIGNNVSFIESSGYVPY